MAVYLGSIYAEDVLYGTPPYKGDYQRDYHHKCKNKYCGVFHYISSELISLTSQWYKYYSYL